MNNAGNEHYFVGFANGYSGLYYDNSQKFKTLSTGAKVIGQLNFDDGSSTANTNGIGFGSSQDTRIFHDGSSFQVRNTTGPLTFITPSHFQISADSSNDTMFKAIQDGAVELYYDNVKTFHTKQNGIRVVGTEGASAVLEIAADEGDDNSDYHRLVADGGTSILYFQNYASGSWENNIRTVGNGAVNLYYDNDAKLSTTSSGVKVENALGIPSLTVESISGNRADVRILATGTGDANVWLDGANGDLSGADYAYLRHDNNLDLKLVNYGGDISLRTRGGTIGSGNLQTSIECNNQGSVELYYAGVKKFETTSLGALVTGRLNVSGNFEQDDNVKANWGNSHDLQIYHDGTSSYITNTTGNLYILATSTETAIQIIPNGAVDLRYDGAKKLETNAEGVRVVGYLEMLDSQRIQMGTGDDLQIYHDGTNSYILENGTGHLNIKTNNQILLTKTPHETLAEFTCDGSNEFYYDGAKKLETTSIGAKISHPGSPVFSVESTLDSSCDAFVDIKGSRTTSTTSDIAAVRYFSNDNADTSTYNGTMPMGSIACRKETASTNKGRFYFRLNTSSGSNLSDIMNLRPNGSLTLNGTLTESSDSKLKQNVVTLSDSLTKVNKLRGVEYDRISTGEKEIGVIAQEVQTVFPELVSTFDENDGTLGVKYTHLTAALIEAIKELTTEVNTLKTKVAALEAK